MTGSSSPCGACKFLRRKCVNGCVFAPYFCHEEGPSHFAAIHKVFGASNVSKILSHLPVSDRSEAAFTLSYEAQARIQDPVYGCVSHIFSLQQQVMNLQAQLASLKQQAMLNGGSNQNPNERLCGKTNSNTTYPQDVRNWLQFEYPNMIPPLTDTSSLNSSAESSTIYGIMNHTNTHTSSISRDNDHVSFAIFEGSSYNSHTSMEVSYPGLENNSKWAYYQDTDDFRSFAFGYPQHS